MLMSVNNSEALLYLALQILPLGDPKLDITQQGGTTTG
jgi:hypothetical protein